MAHAAFPSLPLDHPPTLCSRPNTPSADKSNFDTDIDDNLMQSATGTISTLKASPEQNPFWENSYQNANESSDVPVQWSALQLSLQCRIVNVLLNQGRSWHKISDILGLDPGGLEGIISSVNLKKVHPASVDEIWRYCAARSGYGDNAIDPVILNQYINYMMFADKYEYCTREGICKAQRFLNQLKLDITIDSYEEDHCTDPEIRSTTPGMQSSDYSPLIDTINAGQEDTVSLYDRDATISASPQTIDQWRRFTPYEVSNRTDTTRGSPLIPVVSRLPRSNSPTIDSNAFSTRPRKRRRLDDKSGINYQSPITRNEVGDRNRADGSMDTHDDQVLKDNAPYILSSPQVGSDNSGSQSSISPSSRNLKLIVNENTGVATIIDDPADLQRSPLRSSRTSLHADHRPYVFAAHFNNYRFPKKERHRLLATDLKAMNDADRWLLYGYRSIYSQDLSRQHNVEYFQAELESLLARKKVLNQLLATPPLRPTSSQHTSNFAEKGLAKQLGLRAILEVFSQSKEDQNWEAGRATAMLQHHFDRICVTTVENIERLLAIDRGVTQGYAHMSSINRQKWIATRPDQLWHELRVEAVNYHNIAAAKSCAILAKSSKVGMAPNKCIEEFNNTIIDAGEGRGLLNVQGLAISDCEVMNSAVPKVLRNAIKDKSQIRSNQWHRMTSSETSITQTEARHQNEDSHRDTFNDTRNEFELGIVSAIPNSTSTLGQTRSSLTMPKFVTNIEPSISPVRPDFSPISDYGGSTPWDLSNQICYSNDASKTFTGGKTAGTIQATNVAIEPSTTSESHTNTISYLSCNANRQTRSIATPITQQHFASVSAITGAAGSERQPSLLVENYTAQPAAGGNTVDTSQTNLDALDLIRSFMYSAQTSKPCLAVSGNIATGFSSTAQIPISTRQSASSQETTSLSGMADFTLNQAAHVSQISDTISPPVHGGNSVDSNPATPTRNKSPKKSVRKDCGVKRGPYKKTREKMAREAAEARARAEAAKYDLN